MVNPLGSEFIRLQGSRMQRRAVSTLTGGKDKVLGAWGPCCSGEPGVLGPSMPGWWRSQNRRNEGCKENLCRPLLLLPSIFPSIRVSCNELALRIRWPKCWSFSFSISTSNEYSGLISFRMDGWISLQSKGLSRVFSNTTVRKHQFFGTQPSVWSKSHIHT